MGDFHLFSGIWRRLDEAKKNGEIFPLDGDSDAGRAAEETVERELAQRMAGTGWQLRSNVRVPDAPARRRREIDFVITSPDRVIVLELKNWSGEVALDDYGSLLQHRRYERGTVNHGKLFDDVQERAEVLRMHHLSRGGVPVKVDALVVFFDEYGNLDLHADVAARPDVVTYEKLMEAMPSEGPESSFLERILLGVLTLLGYDTPEKEQRSDKPSDNIASFRQTIAVLGTWDVLVLHGGRRCYGDLLNVEEVDAPTVQEQLLNRITTSAVSFHVDRSRWLAVVREPDAFATAKAEGRDGQATAWQVGTSTPIVFHSPKQVKPIRYEVRNVERLEYGYTEKPKLIDRFDDMSVGMTLVGKVSGSRADGIFVNIGWREAGKPRDAWIPASALAQMPLATRDVLRKDARVLVRIERLLEREQRVFLTLIDVSAPRRLEGAAGGSRTAA